MTVRRALAIGLLLTVIPVPALAGGGHHRRHGHHGHYRHHAPFHYGGHHNDGDIAIAVLGGIVGGVILDRVLSPPPREVVVRDVRPVPPSPAPSDPYDSGYWEGYEEGLERGRRRRYDDGYRRGYEEGVRAGRSGRAASSYY